MNVLILTILIGIQSPRISQDSSWSGDTLLVTGRTIYFFAPTPAEYDSVLASDSSFVEAYADFIFYAKKVCDSTRQKGIQAYISAAPFISIKVDGSAKYLFQKKLFKSKVGVVLVDGVREPKVILGVDTDEGWLQEIKKYYQLK
jgi:hypothetical protein